MTPEEVPGILLLMTLAGEDRRQIEALEWTARERPEFLEWMGYFDHDGGWKNWPLFGEADNSIDNSVRATSGPFYKRYREWAFAVKVNRGAVPQ